MDEFTVSVTVVVILLFGVLGGTCINYGLAAARLREELKRRDDQIQRWGFYFFPRSQRGVIWPEVLEPIARESATAGSLLAWLAHSKRVKDTERLLLAAHQLTGDPRQPRSLEEWRSLGSADLGDEFFQEALRDIAKLLGTRSREILRKGSS